MTIPHLLNIDIHVFAGVVAMAIGFFILAREKGTTLHRKLGKIFCYFVLVVCAAAATGLILFRFLPIFAVITVLVSYQLLSGWRVIYTRNSGPTAVDAALTFFAVMLSIFLAPVVLQSLSQQNMVVYSTFGALSCVLLYDSVRWLFPRNWHHFLWRYEHTYKLLSALFSMLSAFVGNVVRFGQPWSQLLPSLLGIVCIGYFFFKLYKENKKVV
ncbi:MAG: hypothetical protein V4732_21805 [Pseudomonadota bacterium]